MIYCKSIKCGVNLDGKCKHSSIEINDYGRCAYYTSENELVGRIIWYLETYFKEYPFNWEIDRQFLSLVMDEFPELDIFEELKRFRIWLFDQGETKGSNYRSRFRDWLMKNKVISKIL